jgi:hypothetical protein
MPVWWAVALGVLVILIGGIWAARLLLERKPTPEELEQRRRTTVHQTGKMGDGQIVDVEGTTIFYSYRVAGVIYTASQDTTSLQAALPPDPHTLFGPVVVKFTPRNPANSIVVCEEWSGLRQPSRRKT